MVRWRVPSDRSAPPPIPDYALLRRIGQGAYGEVWLACGVTGLFRAVKIVWRDRFASHVPYEREYAGLTRFAAISLAAPRQLALLHIGRDDAAGLFYYVMELADDAERGRDLEPTTYRPCTLKALRDQHGALPAAEVVGLGVDLALALDELHRHGLVHRDIKPSNVIFVGGVPKLADIGLITLATADASHVGTAGYLAPEGPGSHCADVYALGKVLYELATGLDRQDYPRLPTDLGERPDREALFELNEVVMRACQHDPARRFASAGSMLEDLRLLQAGRSVRRLRRAETTARRLHRVAWATIALLLVVTLGFAGQRRAAAREHQRANRESRLRYASDLSLAQLDLLAGDLRRARQRLDGVTNLVAAGPDLAGFEWHALRQTARGDPSTRFRGLEDDIYQVDVSPDGRWIAAAGWTNGLAIWQADTGKLTGRHPETDVLAGVTWDSAALVVVTRSNTTWKLRVDQPDHPVLLAPHRLTQLSPDRRQAWGLVEITGAATSQYRVEGLDLVTDQPIVSFPVPPDNRYDQIWFWSVSPQRLFACQRIRGGGQEQARRLEVWDLQTGTLVHASTPPNTIRHFRFSPDGDLLAYSHSESGIVQVLDTASWRTRWESPPHEGMVFGLAFTPDSARLATASHDRLVRLFDARTGAEVTVLAGHEREVRRVAWSGDGARLVSAGFGGEVRLWEYPFVHRAAAMAGLWGDFGGTVALLPGSRQPAVPGDDGEVRLLDPDTLKPMGRIADAFRILGLDLRGKLVTASRDWQSQLRDPQTFAIETTGTRLLPADEPGGHCGLSARSDWIVAGSYLGTLTFTSLVEERTEVRRSAAGELTALECDPDQQRVAVGYDSGIVEAWSIPPAAAPEWRTQLDSEARSLAWEPGGPRLAAGDLAGMITVFTPPNRHAVTRWRNPAREVGALLFTRDGQRLISGDSGGEIRFWRTSDWSEAIAMRLRSRDGPAGAREVVDLAQSEDGQCVAVLQQNGVLSVLRAAAPVVPEPRSRAARVPH